MASNSFSPILAISIAPDGQLRTHILQPMQFSEWTTGRPRKRSGMTHFTNG